MSDLPTGGPSFSENAHIERVAVSAGQRKINLIWEYTQAIIAILVVIANIAVWTSIGFRGIKVDVPSSLTDALFVIIGFYYGRTNHTAVGGVGSKVPGQER